MLLAIMVLLIPAACDLVTGVGATVGAGAVAVCCWCCSVVVPMMLCCRCVVAVVAVVMSLRLFRFTVLPLLSSLVENVLVVVVVLWVLLLVVGIDADAVVGAAVVGLCDCVRVSWFVCACFLLGSVVVSFV